MAAAGLLLLNFHKYCKTKLKLINEEEDRKIIEGLTQEKIFQSTATPKEIATLMRVYRALKVAENSKE